MYVTGRQMAWDGMKWEDIKSVPNAAREKWRMESPFIEI